MHLTFAPRGVLQFDDARIVYRNFSGAASKRNREGDRNFSVVIPDQEMADALIKDGWNVKIKPPKNEGDDPFMTLPVKVKFNDYGPSVYLKSGKKLRKLDEAGVGRLDRVHIINVNLDIRPYDWEVNGKTGRTAYLKSIKVTQEVDRFEEEYEEYEEENYDEENSPF